MTQSNEVLVRAIRKLALAGEKAGFTVEEMIELLNTGVSVETLLNLICFRLELSDYQARDSRLIMLPEQGDDYCAYDKNDYSKRDVKEE